MEETMRRIISTLLTALLIACAGPPPAPAPTPTSTPAPPTASPSPIPIAPEATAAPEAGPAATGEPLRVLADPALGPSLAELTNAFANLFPGQQVELELAPSAEIVARLGAGETADVIGLAGLAPVQEAVAAGHIAEDLAIPIATDRLVLVAPFGGTADASALDDPATRLALLDAVTPAGAAAREALELLGASADAATSFPDEAALIAALVAGEADLAILYASAITPLVELDVRYAELPREAQVTRAITIAPTRAARPELAEEFIALVASGAGQATLSAYNLLPAASDTAGPP